MALRQRDVRHTIQSFSLHTYSNFLAGLATANLLRLEILDNRMEASMVKESELTFFVKNMVAIKSLSLSLHTYSNFLAGPASANLLLL